MKNTKQTPATVRDRARRALDKAALEATTGAASCTACGHLSALESDLASELR
jgi:hypothetical protein